MGLADDLGSIRTESRIDEVLSELDDEDREALLAALRNPRVGASAVAGALDKNGFVVHHGTITRWRRDHPEEMTGGAR